MRDIKFRGKFLDDTSEWLYGNYVYIEDDVFHHKIADKSGLLLDIDIKSPPSIFVKRGHSLFIINLP